MKNFARNFILLMLALLFISTTGRALVAHAAPSESHNLSNRLKISEGLKTPNTAYITSVYFRLSGWDGPLFVDIKANCSFSASVYAGEALIKTRGPLNGTWRVTFPTLYAPPRSDIDISIYCQGSSGQWDIRKYLVYYSGGTISATRQ